MSGLPITFGGGSFVRSGTTIRLSCTAISFCMGAFTGAGVAIGQSAVPIRFGLVAFPVGRPPIIRGLPSVGGGVSARQVRTVEGIVRDRCSCPRLGERCGFVTICSSLISPDRSFVPVVCGPVTLRCDLVSLIGNLISVVGGLISVVGDLVAVLARQIALLARQIAPLAGLITLLARLVALLAGLVPLPSA